MHVVPRNQLKDYLTGSRMDPDQTFQEEMGAFAQSILADSQATHFLHSDHENGSDPEVGYPDLSRTSLELVPLRHTSFNGYYGVDRHAGSYGDGPKVYHCYLGGSPAQSAPGFVLTEVSVG